MYEGQRTTVYSWPSPSSFTWIQRAQLKLPRVAQEALYPLSPLTSSYISEGGVECVTCVEGYMCMCVCMCVNGGYRLVFSDFLDHSPFHFCLFFVFLWVSFSKTRAHWLAGLAFVSPHLHLLLHPMLGLRTQVSKLAQQALYWLHHLSSAQCLFFWRTPGFSKAATLLHSHQQWYKGPNFYIPRGQILSLLFWFWYHHSRYEGSDLIYNPMCLEMLSTFSYAYQVVYIIGNISIQI